MNACETNSSSNQARRPDWALIAALTYKKHQYEFRQSKSLLRECLRCILGFAILAPLLIAAQWPVGVPTMPDAQRNALNAVQSQAYGANDLAEMDAGLDILQGAFCNYEQDIADGRPVGPALNKMCQVLRQGSDLWLQELKRKASRLRIGRG